ncbi:MAG: hypothetical protein IPL65_17210 [Lewinellaceae bacterium]|nr:hypothetical protein [Lewinellaceae bacterium]
MMFDPNVLPKRTNKDKSMDVVQTSAVNFYENVSAKEVEDFYHNMLKTAGEKHPMLGLNSKLVKEDGKLVEKVWKSGGMYGSAIDRVIENLQKAIPYAEIRNKPKHSGS